MKMKFLLLLSLLLTSQLVYARPTAMTEKENPQANILIRKILSPYLKTKTFSGTFYFLEEVVDIQERHIVFKRQMQTTYRLDQTGKRIREAIQFSSRRNIPSLLKSKSPSSQTLRIVDDGQTQTQVDLEAKAYAHTRRNNEVGPVRFLSPTLNRIAGAIQRDGSTISYSRASADQSLINVSSKGKVWFNELHIVIDDKTGALKTLSFSSSNSRIAISASNQVFGAPVRESQFQWTPPANFKQVEENQLTPAMQGFGIGIVRPTRSR